MQRKIPIIVEKYQTFKIKQGFYRQKTYSQSEISSLFVPQIALKN